MQYVHACCVRVCVHARERASECVYVSAIANLDLYLVAKGKEPKITTLDGRVSSDSHQVNKSDSSIGVIAGSAVAVIVCMIIVIIMVVIFLRK